MGLILEQPETIGDAMIHAEIRSHLASLKAGERTAFIDVHATEGAAAAASLAPSFLSGLTPAELDVVKQRIEARATRNRRGQGGNGKGAARDRSRLVRGNQAGQRSRWSGASRHSGDVA